MAQRKLTSYWGHLYHMNSLSSKKREPSMPGPLFDWIYSLYGNTFTTALNVNL